MTKGDAGPLVAAPYATGGGGVVLEHRYGAVLLASVLTEDPLQELGDDVTPVMVRFQASVFSRVDDLLVTGRAPDGGQRRVSIGVRRAPRLVTSDEASVPLLASYLRVVTESWEEVRAGRWRLSLAVSSPNPAVKQSGELTVIARAYADEAGFRTEVARPRRTNQGVRNRLPHLDALVGAALQSEGVEAGEITGAELTWRLLSSLRVRELRLEGADKTDRTFAVSRLRSVTRGRTAAEADDLFGRLAALADDYAPAGAEVTEPMLRRDLSGTPYVPLRLGTPSSTALAQLGEANPANLVQEIEATRRAEDRRDALEKERREAIRSDYRGILLFVARTRLFVLEMRDRLAGLEDWSAHVSTDAREVEDLEARAEILRRRFLDELPAVQSLVGVWAPANLIAIFDEIDDFGPKIAAAISVALHLRFDGKRIPDGIDMALGELDHLVTLLNQARDLLRAELLPS